MEADCFDELVVLTDALQIEEIATQWGATVHRTERPYRNGTERVADYAQRSHAQYFVNVQGDEVGLTGSLIREEVAKAVICQQAVWTLVHPIASVADVSDPDIVKVARESSGFARYFSRSPIPHIRDSSMAHVVWGHIGLYGYSRENLDRYIATAPSLLEMAEDLEQLRFLEIGVPIYCECVEAISRSINRKTDLL